MEKFNGCFIIANFDSLEGDNKESMQLLETLSANFNEKCVIAANDVSFPSNRARFSNRIQFFQNFINGQLARILKTLLSYRRTVEYQRVSFTHAQKTSIQNCDSRGKRGAVGRNCKSCWKLGKDCDQMGYRGMLPFPLTHSPWFSLLKMCI